VKWRSLALVGCGMTAVSVMWFLESLDQHALALSAQTAANERTNLALARSNRDLDQFAYVASHDLKAPLRGIANLATWIDEELGDVPPGQSREHLRLLRTRVDRLEALIQGILTYARAGRVATAQASVDIQALVHETIDLLAPPEHVTIAIGASLPQLVTDRAPLQQCFVNLIGNAIKHGGAAIRIGGSPSDAGWRFWVHDNGPGIPAEYQGRVFELFETLAPRDEVEGAGIGLAVVKRLVEARGGEVSVISKAGQGARFEFTWPLA
jgi:signal transduction histidine kinase